MSEQTKKLLEQNRLRVPNWKRFPDTVIAQLLTTNGARPEDIDVFFGDYLRRMTDPPLTWGHLTASLENWLHRDDTRRFLDQNFDDSEAADRRKVYTSQNRTANTSPDQSRFGEYRPDWWDGTYPETCYGKLGQD